MHRGAVGDAKFAEQGLRRRDLIGLVGNIDVGEHGGGIGGERAQYLRRGVAALRPLPKAVQRYGTSANPRIRSMPASAAR
jgi:hypothetical protein